MLTQKVALNRYAAIEISYMLRNYAGELESRLGKDHSEVKRVNSYANALMEAIQTGSNDEVVSDLVAYTSSADPLTVN